MARSEFKFAWPFRVRYSEVDGQRIVFNAHYLTYYDTAITEYFRALPYDYIGQVERTGEDFHTVRTLVEYQQPIEFDEDMDLGAQANVWGEQQSMVEEVTHFLGVRMVPIKTQRVEQVGAKAKHAIEAKLYG